MGKAGNAINPEVLTCGLRVRLLAMETTKSKWSASLVGAKTGRYLIFETPRVNSLPVIFDDGSRWSVNFIAHGLIHLFDCEVIGSISRPTSLVFFTYPEKAEISNLRTVKRYPVRIPATFETLPPEPEFAAKGLVLDLSSGGCLTATTMEIAATAPLKMTLYLGQSSTVDLLVEKRTFRQQQGTFFTGFSFMATNPANVAERLENFLNDIQSMPLRI
jgi:c-di-GMP-binding flagellar brake protein YcgR